MNAVSVINVAISVLHLEACVTQRRDWHCTRHLTHWQDRDRHFTRYEHLRRSTRLGCLFSFLLQHDILLTPSLTRHTTPRTSSPRLRTSMPIHRRGVAQWLGRRSVAGGLSLIYAWSMHGWRVTTSWERRPLWVNQPGQLSLLPPVGRGMSSISV